MKKTQYFALFIILPVLFIWVAIASTQGGDTSTFLPIISRSGPIVEGINGVIIIPDAIFVNEPEEVTVLAAIPYNPAAGIPNVLLQKVDESGTIIGTVGNLTDDGDLNNGDEIAGDGVFTTLQTMSSPQEERIWLRVDVQNTPLTSDIFFLDSITHLTDEDLTQILTLQDTAVSTYEALVVTLGEEGARDAVLADLQQEETVIQAGISESGFGIWTLYNAGVIGALELNPPGTRGGAQLDDRPIPPPPPVPTVDTPVQIPSLLNINGDENEIQNNKAIVLGAFNWDFGVTDDAPGIQQILTNTSCPSIDVTYLLDNSVTVGVMKTLNQYGIIVMTSHGDTYYNGILSLWQDKWGWNYPFGQVVILTGEQATTANRAANEIDLKQGRLAITSSSSGGYYAVLPSFIRHYAGEGYGNSLIYFGSCRSTYNSSMADAFLDNGANTYLGYSEYVDSAFAGTAGVNFFEQLFNDENVENVGDAFITGQNDGGNPPAYFELIGDTSLELASSQLKNGNFETGTPGAWTTSGDGRVIGQLGNFQPTDENYMGIISTGLGFTTSSGSISQDICIPEDAQVLTFNWNFNSEEFLEWCTSIYQDFFRVDVTTEAGTENLFYRSIDNLCGSVSATTLAFDQSGPGCNPSEFNDCQVWSTGWQSQALDISTIAANHADETITLSFSAGDVGDSIFDSAILLDEITIMQP